MKKLKDNTKKEFIALAIVVILILFYHSCGQSSKTLLIILLWALLKPVKMLIECFFDSSKESEKNND